MLSPIGKVIGTGTGTSLVGGTTTGTGAPGTKPEGRVSTSAMKFWVPARLPVTWVMPPAIVTPEAEPETILTPGTRMNSSPSSVPLPFSS